jgi:hypothetical protein
VLPNEREKNASEHPAGLRESAQNIESPEKCLVIGEGCFPVSLVGQRRVIVVTSNFQQQFCRQIKNRRILWFRRSRHPE